MPFTSIAKPLARLGLMALTLVAAAAWAQVRIAVTDLSYEEKVARYFESVELKGKWDERASARERYRDSDFSSSGSATENYRSKGEASFKAQSGYTLFIERGELRKFTGDIKGELLKAGYRVAQGKPWTQSNTEKLYDIIERIKQGYFPNTDYVLFGTVTNVEFRREDNPIQGSNATNHMLALELVAEFSLINTKTYEIKAAFSAMGEGQDARMINAVGATVQLNRSKVMFQVAKSLGESVASEVSGQFSEGAGAGRRNVSARNEVREVRVVEEKVIVFK